LDYRIKCSIGKRGIKKKRTEGDKSTPKGIFKIKYLLYRKDRLSGIRTKLKKYSIKKNMGWCDDVNYKKDYNKLITIKKKIKHEKLYRKDSKYDFLIPISYNRKKTIPGKGSAIFLHLTNNYKGTLGCVTLKKNDFLILLKLIDKNTKIKII